MSPAWLADLAPEAKVVAFAKKELDQFVTANPGQEDLKDIIVKLTGGPLNAC